MPRTSRVTPGGMVFHVLNRGVGWMRLFHSIGHFYQGRFKSFPISSDEYFYQVARYVERNALRANLVQRAEDWRWSSLWRREAGSAEQRRLLSAWPLAEPSQWVKFVNRPETEAELTALRRSVNRGQPYGPESWMERRVRQLGLESTIRPRGRPRRTDSTTA